MYLIIPTILVCIPFFWYMYLQFTPLEYKYITIVSRASAHSRVSAQVLVLAARMESAHSRVSAQARSLQSCMASAQAASARQHAKGRLHQGTFHRT